MSIRPKNCILSHYLLQCNDKPFKFYLDGYNAWEFHSIAKIIEAFGGQLTVPDNETIIFAEPNRPVEKYYYRYNIEYIHDCLIARQMLDIQKYLLPRKITKGQRSETVVAPTPLERGEMKDTSHFQGVNSLMQEECEYNSSYCSESPKRRSRVEAFRIDSFTTIHKNTHVKMPAMPLEHSDIIENNMPELVPQEQTISEPFAYQTVSQSKPKDDVILISDDSYPKSSRLDYSSSSPSSSTPPHPPFDALKRRHEEFTENGQGAKRQRPESVSSCTNLSTKSNLSSATTVNVDKHGIYDRESSIDTQMTSSTMRCPVARKSTIKNGKLQRRKDKLYTTS